ncbi:RN213 ligase, partial [Agelaius phoeniceus]|nr:RN213 ligase [Agelaius phoeniceus]
LEEHGYLIEGDVTLSREILNDYIPYKYWVTCGKGEYEFIYKNTVSNNPVNRCLLINSRFLKNGVWHQYDDIVCAKPSTVKNIRQKLSLDKNKEIVEGKKIAANIMLESIFSILETWNPDNLSNFFCQMRQFHYVAVGQRVFDGRPMPWKELNFSTEQVNDLLLKYLKTIALPFLAPEGRVMQRKLDAGFTILLLYEHCSLPEGKSDLADLCSLLCLDQLKKLFFHSVSLFCFLFLFSLTVELKNLCQRCIELDVDQWVWVLPLLHSFSAPLQQEHEPVEEDAWAGLQGLPFAETRMKQDVATRMLARMREKRYLMQFDGTLVKSWLCVVPLESLADFIEDFTSDPLLILQGVLYRLDNVELSCNSSQKINSPSALLPCRALGAPSWRCCMSRCLRLHERLCKAVRTVMLFLIPATAATLITKVAQLQPPAVPGDAVEEVPMEELLSGALKEARAWFRKVLDHKLLKKHSDHVIFSFSSELEVWDKFVKISFPDKKFAQKWRNALLADLKNRIQQEPPVNQILVYCSQHYYITRMDSSISQCFQSCAIEAVSAACQMQNNLLERISAYNMGKFSQLVSAVMVKSWPVRAEQSEGDFDTILHHLLTWPDIKHIFSFYGTNRNHLDKLTDKAKKVIAIADSALTSITSGIYSGCILVKHLKEIFKHKEQFFCIWETSKRWVLRGMEQSQKSLKKELALRHEEVTQLTSEKEAIGTFVRMCRGIQKPVRVVLGKVEYQHSIDLHSKSLEKVVKVGKRPLETFYDLSPKMKKFVCKMHSFKDSLIFQKFWEEAVEKVGKKYERDSSEEEEDKEEIVPKLDLNDILNSMIRPCFNSYAELYDGLRSGSLPLFAVDRIFQEFMGYPDQLRAELNTICELQPAEDRGWVDQRVQQIQQYYEIDSIREAIRIIDRVKECLGLSGDFRILEKLLHITQKLEPFQNQKLDSISPELVQAKQLLQGITQPRCSCLKELARQKEFVCWVREALKDMNEVKVFVDLASISAGENDMDVDRVACFHGTVHGYSSLLYELHQDSGFEDFMSCLEKLWRALDSDKNLPDKLRASAQHLEWLKTVKETHGSVELSSLSLAAAINSRGVYELKAPADGQKVSLDSVLHFTLAAASKDTEASQKYSLAELCELQNKLMLMSAKGEQGLEVERFSEVFSNVQSLAQAFIDLYSAGNMLFRSWLAQVYCSPRREYCVLMNFSLGPIPALKGQGDMAAVLPALCKTMESFLESWKSFMNAKRCEHFYLNYYSAEQLVFLCSELGRGRPSQAALMMLSFLNPHCTEQDVLTTLRNQGPPSSGKAASDFQVLMDGERDLNTRLKHIWECYMSNMGSFLPNCLDIDTLGVWLRNLASSGRERVTRDFPRDLLCVGQPNLITCPRSEVLSSALAIYMNSPKQPLPTFDEVLLCTPQTSAECNPYRKHTDRMIQRLELAGLGYRVKADDTREKLGSIPLRQLVYRVHALPPSMVLLVWDFGQLNSRMEKMYIQQIVQHVAEQLHVAEKLPMAKHEVRTVTEVLFASQEYMRQTDNECSFVSLRDVERCMEVFKWFYRHSSMLLTELSKYLADRKAPKSNGDRNEVIWSLVLAVGVCYHASLERKEPYRTAISQVLPKPYNTQKKILEEISLIQDLFLSGVPLHGTIARNLALKENVFMMVICIELKIPLFLVGKPGSSKSLAKTIVADAMQGQAAHSDLFKHLKQIHLVSFQCSPLSTPEGIIGTFKHCARFQEGKNLEEYVSVVVLDEIGLAEDSPKMPLKTLHPLLEDGCIDDVPDPHKKVGFIGISNWALDPAKMNRGIFVSRGDPSREELIKSAKGICCSARGALQKVEQYFDHFADAYENICKAQDREFFGLRDYYSLIKMFFALAKSSSRNPTPQDIATVVLRNFGGKDDVNALEIFTSKLPEKEEIRADDISRIELIRQNIYSSAEDGDCRYLLVLTENYVALQILQQTFFTARQQPEIIFGSSFPKDQEYTQICRNINRVKVCMETGHMVVLLNLQNLYESLYDALNQYYVYLAGQKYVDLGLGTHRVKCRVHPEFRLIVIEEKEVVYKHFPIPLINRLEKHYLDISTMLDKGQREAVQQLERWVQEFTAVNTEDYFMSQQQYSPADVFVGYHADTCASLVLQGTQRLGPACDPAELLPRVTEQARLALLNCATPDAIIRLCNSVRVFMAPSPDHIYFRQQQHTSFADFLRAHVGAGAGPQTTFTEVTTFSWLLTSADAACLEREVQGKAQRPQILFLQQFDTEYSFLKCIRNFLDSTSENKVLIIQTDFEDGSKDAQLITSAKYAVVNEINKVDLGEVSVFVYFIMKLSRLEGGTSYMGFQGGLWQSVHIDDLRRSKDMNSNLIALQNLTISQVFSQDPALPANGEAQQEKVGETVPGAEHHEGEILNTTVLLRTCVQSAVGMLRDQNEDPSRSRRRIEILLGLFSRENELKASFLKTTKARLSSLLKRQEENSLHLKNWVFREACNLSALQEAGTFRHALWKRVQKVVTPFLALLIAVIDRNGNLELMARAGANWVTNLWMFIFNDTKFLSVGKNSPQREIIVVQNNMMVSADAGNEMPFSWRIKEYLEEMWLETQYIQNTEGHAEKFVEYFQKTALGKFISALTGEERQLLFECYIRDFTVLTIGVSSPEQLQCLCVAFLSCVKEWMAESPWTKELVPSLPWAHLAHNQFKSRLQNFSRILAVYPCVTGYLLTQKECRTPCSEMVLDVLAAMVCAEDLEKLVQTASPELWLQKVKNLHMPIEFLCKEEGAQCRGSHCHQLLRKLRACWSRVFAMALFVEHVLLGIHTIKPEFKDLVRKYTSLLAECFQHDSDMKSHPTFVAVLRVLHKCKDEVSSRLYRHGLELCPICLGEPKDPICLPCNHVFCRKCIRQWLVPAQMHCPCCRAAVEDVELTVSEELRAAVEKKALFRQRCNNFFIDVVTTMCFKDNKPPEPEVIWSLLDLLFVERKNVLKDPNHPAVYTKFLSPFNDEVDETPIIRSVMLKLLLKYSFNEVKDDVQRYLSQVEHNELLEEKDKKELYLLFVNCLEDSMCEKLEDSLGCGHGNSLPEDRAFPENYLPASSSEAPQQVSVEYLQAVAEVRLCLSRAAELIFDLQQHTEPKQMKEKQHYLKKVEKFCSLAKNDWHRVYLVRRISSQHGMEFAQKLVTEPRFSWVFPAEILQQVQHSQSNHIDRYLVYGEQYQALRDAVGQAMMEGTAQRLLEAQQASNSPPALESAHLLLAIFREVTALYGNPDLHPKRQQTEMMTKFIHHSQVLNSSELELLAVALVKNTLPGLAVEPRGRSQQGAVVEMAVHMAAVLLCGHSRVLQPLRNLAFEPRIMQRSFLPTMPEDIMAQARTWEGTRSLHWYECPNGHPCTVGECGRPMERSLCPECHVLIGGRNHIAVQGFHRSSPRPDRTQTGHILGDVEHRGTLGTSDRNMSPTVFVLLRLLTHLSMLLGASRDTQSLGRMIKPRVDDVVSFLQQHIQEDLAQLTGILGKSVDDTINILHLVLSSLLQAPQRQPGQWLVWFDDFLSTKDKRNKWEEIVASTIIVPELKDLDKKLLKLNRQIQKDKRISSNPIVKIVYGDPAAFLSQLPRNSHIHHSKMWSCRRKVSVENLSHIVQQKNAKDTVPLLWKFLQKESELRLVKFLPEILALQKDLVKQFQNTAEIKDCSIREFLREPHS